VRGFLLLAGLALVTACGRAPAPNPGPDPAPEEPAPNVRTTSLMNGFITIRAVLPPHATGPVPAIVTFLGGDDVLAAMGVAAVSYEIHWKLLRGLAPPKEEAPPPAPGTPPRTWGKWLLASPSPRTVGQGYFQLIAGNGEQTVPKVLDWLATLPEIDAGRLGVAGFSTNGFVALVAAAHDPRIRVAVAVAACGDWPTFLAQSPLALGGEEPFDPEPAYRRFIARTDPIRHPRRLVHAALLMVNGDDDPAIPFACASATADALRRAYAAAGVPERFRFAVVPGGGHEVQPDARWETLGWVQRWLVETPPAALGGPRRRSTPSARWRLPGASG